MESKSHLCHASTAYTEQPDLKKAPKQFKINHNVFPPFLPRYRVSAAPITAQIRIISIILILIKRTAIKDADKTAIGRTRATFVGIQVAGIPGAVIATTGCILPSCVIVMTLASIYYRYNINSHKTNSDKRRRQNSDRQNPFFLENTFSHFHYYITDYGRYSCKHTP